LNLAAGTAYCGNPPVAVTYAGGTLTLTASQTNYVYLDPAATCVPAFNITGFAVGQIPLAKVVTGGSTITTVTDVRSWFVPLACAMSSAGAIKCAALGTDQNITLTPSGTGYTILNGNLGIGTTGPATKLDVYSSTINVRNSGVDAALSEVFRTTLADFPQATDWRNSIYSSVSEQVGNGILKFSLADTRTTQKDVLTLLNSGNAGIGKTPGANAQLDVAKAIVSGLNVVTFSATPTFDAALGNTQKITLTDNVTSSTLSNATAGETINFIICQDATGSRTFVWPTNVLGGMTIGATLSKCSAQNFIFDGTNAYALSAGVTNM
jgi:hypothetical protein